MNRHTILAVDDDLDLQTVMHDYLERDGYKCLSAFNGTALLQGLETAHPDVILLDLILPKDNGLALLSAIRRKSNAAVIVISGKDAAVDRIVCLEMGADDYLTKPFELRELSARIKAVLRRTQHKIKLPDNAADMPLNKAGRISFNGWVLDRLQYQLFDVAGKTVKLTSGEFKLLETLVMAPNRALSREHLFSLTSSGTSDTPDQAIDTQIIRIRKKINDNQRSPAFLKTVRGIGYLFAGETTAVG